MSATYIYLIIFACFGYLIITDESISQLIRYLSKLIQFQYEKTKWLIFNDPRNPIVKYLIYRRSLKMAEELMKDLTQKDV